MLDVQTDAARPLTLVQRMRAATADLHVEAERSGIVAAIVAGRVSRAGYALYLRNLFPVYESMERVLLRLRDRPGIGEVAQPGVFRSASIASDLDRLAGPDWVSRLPLLPAGACYVRRVEAAGLNGGSLLIAHAYTRYLGDLSGGRIMRRRLAGLFGPDSDAMAFTDFPALASPDEFAVFFRNVLNRACDLPDQDRVAGEAVRAFQLNIRLSRSVDAWTRSQAGLVAS